MAANTSRHEILVALHVHDDSVYDEYRARMKPILHSIGGYFRRDFRISESLAEGDPSVNRVFIISFPDKPTMDRFFNDPDYKKARAEFFDASVSHTDTVAAYDLPG